MQSWYALLWFGFIIAATAIAGAILHRRGTDGVAWALATMIGAGATLVLVIARDVLAIVGVFGVALFVIGCFGLIVPRRKTEVCYKCGYDLRATKEAGSLRCPECGTPLIAKEYHCLECGLDLHQTIARGGIICPDCQAPIDDRFLPQRN